jgi:hypothetical protein
VVQLPEAGDGSGGSGNGVAAIVIAVMALTGIMTLGIRSRTMRGR